MSRALHRRLVYAAIFILFPSASAFSFRGGPPAARTGSPASGGLTCAQCHSDPTGTGSVQLIGAPMTYQAGQMYGLKVRVHDPSPSRAAAGFEISVETPAGVHAGTLMVTDAINTQTHATGGPAWLHHTAAGVNNSVASWSLLGEAAEYMFAWEAPSADFGPVTFWVVGNAINDNGLPNGDKVYSDSVTATFDPAPIAPTVSTWGLIALAELVLVGGTLLAAEQRQPPAAGS